MARLKYKQSRAYVAATAVSAFLMLIGALAVKDHSVGASDAVSIESASLTDVQGPVSVRQPQPVQTPKPHTRTKAS